MTAAAGRLAGLRPLFRAQPGTIFLDSATYGLPPSATVDALERGLRAWEAGTADWIEDWDRPSDQCRADFATLIGATADEIACIPATSVGTGLVAATLGPGDEVLVAADEFTSVLYPLLVAAGRGVAVREVPLLALADEIRPETRLVAFSLVQMQTGQTADLAAICAAAGRHGARVFVDATQGVPFVQCDPYIGQVDYLACSAYKHLLCPRGVAFLYVRRDRWDDLAPLNANWRAADLPFARYFGGPLRLAADAARFDVSRAWLPWLGAIESLRLLRTWKEQGLLGEVVDLAALLAGEIGVRWGGGTLVSVPVVDAGAAQRALAASGIRAAARGQGVRFATHVYNSEADVRLAAQVIAPHVAVTGR